MSPSTGVLQRVPVHYSLNHPHHYFFFPPLLDPPPKKMVLSATIPEEFNFSTTTRSKTAATASATAQRDVDFVSQLRKPASPVSA